jgi:peptidoglycan biosynthesis protein MviN/MurJ (putative lipid II flippase)
VSGPDGGGGTLARSAAITSVAQAVSMLAGGVLAVLVAVRIGNDARTDGFFAAYGAYSIAALFAQSARTTIVARIIEPGAFDRYVGAVLVLFAGFGVAFAALGDPLAAVLTGDRPVAGDVARTSLLILWPAVGGQLFGALAAAMLGTRGDFATPAFAFAGGGLVSIVAFLALEPALGIDAVPAGILCGSTVTGAVLAVALARTGWRPDVRAALDVRAGSRAAGVMILSSLAFLLSQIGFVISLAVAARLGEGVVTVYSYSSAAVNIVMALLGSVPSIVLAAPLATSWDRRPATLLPHHRTVWLVGLLLLAPVVAAAWLVGDDLGRVVLAKFTDAEVELTVELFLLLAPIVACSVAVSLPVTALYTLGRYRVVAVVAAVTLAIHTAVSLVAGAIESVDLMAGAVSISGAVSVFAYLYVLAPAYLRDAGRALLAGLLRIGLLAAAAFVPPALVLPDAAALAAGLALFVGIVVAAMPDERALGARLLAIVQRSGAPAS